MNAWCVVLCAMCSVCMHALATVLVKLFTVVNPVDYGDAGFTLRALLITRHEIT